MSTPQSQNLDAAALYFLEDAGRGGFGGYLGSNSDDNEFLLSPKLKMLVGYPVDGIATANQGRMHATPASKVTFAQSYGHTFTTSDISSSGGKAFNVALACCVASHGAPAERGISRECVIRSPSRGCRGVRAKLRKSRCRCYSSARRPGSPPSSPISEGRQS